MKIVIDARLFGPEHTGIGRYSQNLVENLAPLALAHQLILITHKNAKVTSTKNLQVIFSEIPYYGFSEQLKLNSLIKSLSPDLVHFTHFNHPIIYNQPFVVTIHDLIKSDFKDHSASSRKRAIYEAKHFIYGKVVSHAIYKSKNIITPSNYSKGRILSLFPKVSPAKIVTIYEGADQFQKIRIQKILDYKKYSISDNFCLYIGNSYPYKNLATAIDAVKKISGLQFVIVSKNTPNLEELKLSAGRTNKFVFLENLTDSELAGLYKKSKFFLFPSKSEGFGVPGLEAMAMQTPVLCSSAGPLPEIYGNAALYFNPESVSDLVRQIQFLLTNYDQEKNKLNSKAKNQLKKYSWQKMAKETLNVYESCFNS